MTTADRLLFSTDYPFQEPSQEDITAFLASFSDGDREKFCSANAAALFGLDV